MKRAIGYARVSTLTQKDNETIEEQIKALGHYAKVNEYDLVDIYRDDGVSGSDEDRVIRLCRYVQERKEEFDVLLFTYFDRLSRDLFSQLYIEKELQKLGKSYLAIYQESLSEKDQPSAVVMRQVMGAFAEFEKNMIAKRLANGRRHKTLDRGIKASGNVPFGYAYEGKSTKEKHVVVVPEQAEVVQEMFSMALGGQSVGKIVKELNERGVLNSHRRPFTEMGVHKMLRNGFYKGKVQYDGDVVHGDHEAIISPVLFGRVQAALGRRAKNGR